MKFFMSKGVRASQLRQRKYALVREYGFPEALIGGSLSRSTRRCGKASCHCVTGQGHANEIWAQSHGGQRRAHHIPRAWSESFAQLKADSERYLAALETLLELNAELFELDIRARREKSTRRCR